MTIFQKKKSTLLRMNAEKIVKVIMLSLKIFIPTEVVSILALIN